VSDVWKQSTLRALTVPGGVVLVCAAILAHTQWIALPGPSLNFLSYCALLGGMLLAWRFHASRIFLALLIVYLSQLAIGRLAPLHGRVWIASGVALLGVLIPLNFGFIGLMQERGFIVSSVAPALLFIFVQSVLVAVLAGGAEPAARLRHAATYVLPNYVFVAFAIAGLLLLGRFLGSRKPADSALFWSLVACLLSLCFHPVMRVSAAYWLAALSILAISIVETSYLFAYHDELTGLPSRRTFNDALHGLEPPYSIAAVDIDHFKSFNDTYGHDVGDQVLRLVAGKLAGVAGGGHAYRCGGEEFTILFPGKLSADVTPHLEQLRLAIESAEFRMRGGERRRTPRGRDRRSAGGRVRTRKADAIRQLARPVPTEHISVTVSIGVASCISAGGSTEEVLKAADKALYRAKANGRNCVEIAPSRRARRAKAEGIA